MVVKIIVNRNDLMRVTNRIKRVGRLPKYAIKASKRYLEEVKVSVGRQLIIEKARNRSRASRSKINASILNATINTTSRDVALNIPEKASALDQGVGLRGGGNKINLGSNSRARKWVQRYYSRRAIKRVSRGSLKSKPYGPKGGLTGYLKIVRHPFISEGHRKVRHRLRTLINQEIKKSLKGG